QELLLAQLLGGDLRGVVGLELLQRAGAGTGVPQLLPGAVALLRQRGGLGLDQREQPGGRGARGGERGQRGALTGPFVGLPQVAVQAAGAVEPLLQVRRRVREALPGAVLLELADAQQPREREHPTPHSSSPFVSVSHRRVRRSHASAAGVCSSIACPRNAAICPSWASAASTS